MVKPLEPEVLRDEGILRDPGEPDQAHRRGAVLMGQGKFAQARSVLKEHGARLDELAPELGVAVACGLGRCALALGGEEEDEAAQWFDKALRLAAASAAPALLCEAHVAAAQGAVAKGALGEARNHLAAVDIPAEALIRAEGLHLRAAVAEVEAKIALAQGDVAAAQQAVDGVLEVMVKTGQNRQEGLLRLLRARICVLRLQTPEATGELVRAYRLLKPRAADYVAAHVAHAACLVWSGRLADGRSFLRGVLGEILAQDDRRLHAETFHLLGLALVRADPDRAYAHLVRAQSLYQELAQPMAVVACSLDLGRIDASAVLQVDARADVVRAYGPRARARFDAIMAQDLREWTLLRLERDRLLLMVRPAALEPNLWQVRFERCVASAAAGDHRVLLSHVEALAAADAGQGSATHMADASCLPSVQLDMSAVDEEVTGCVVAPAPGALLAGVESQASEALA